ncbi:hypothetical protein GCM10019016_005440 [Streptomyces prasinosporus]|uniref:Uncharacterized protein n=1 Tax=Streptomyces prasinosporus TaxID=68256 RepID=A0ABP6TFD0_9ACTN|nr:hypothetical protein GCM10010332_07310 [Streptomyces albogriseolus]
MGAFGAERGVVAMARVGAAVVGVPTLPEEDGRLTAPASPTSPHWTPFAPSTAGSAGTSLPSATSRKPCAAPAPNVRADNSAVRRLPVSHSSATA